MLLAAIAAAAPDASSRFLGVFASTVPVAEFMSPESVEQILRAA